MRHSKSYVRYYLAVSPSPFDNIPDIVDANRLIAILESMGVKVQKHTANKYTFQADEIDLEYVESKAFHQKAQKLRGSIMLVGPLLARFGKAFISRPGGDKIGRRRLDTHFRGFQDLGADFQYDVKNGTFKVATTGRLKGTYMLLDEASVTGNSQYCNGGLLSYWYNYHLPCSM